MGSRQLLADNAAHLSAIAVGYRSVLTEDIRPAIVRQRPRCAVIHTDDLARLTFLNGHFARFRNTLILLVLDFALHFRLLVVILGIDSLLGFLQQTSKLCVSSCLYSKCNGQHHQCLYD